MRTVLVVATYYPPDVTVGALRISKFVQYLPAAGWNPIVLAPGPVAGTRSRPDVVRTPDRSLHRWLRGRLGTGRGWHRDLPATGSAGLSGGRRFWAGVKFLYASTVNFPDQFTGWVPGAVRAGQQVIAVQRPTLIFSSSPGPSAHVVAARLARLSGLPWVAEFRDLWTDNYDYCRPAACAAIEKRLERCTLAASTALVTVSEPLADILVRRFQRPTAVVYNGYDPAAYPRPAAPPSQFTICYTGRTYPVRRDPGPFFQALRQLLDRGVLGADDLDVQFVGAHNTYAAQRARAYGLESVVHFAGDQAWPEALRRQQRAAVLLVLEWNHPRAAGILTTKVFEYLGAGRPVLALAYPAGALARLLDETRGGVVAGGAEALAAVLADWYRTWRRTGRVPFTGRQREIARYTRQAQTRVLARFFDGVCAARVSGTAAGQCAEQRP